MTTLREAAQMALVALSAHADIGLRSDKAIDALRSALEQPEPELEPVAWGLEEITEQHLGQIVKPHRTERYCVPLYTAPPQRKPLTDEQIKRILTSNGFKTYPELGDDLKPYCYAAIRAIERAHRIGVNDGE